MSGSLSPVHPLSPSLDGGSHLPTSASSASLPLFQDSFSTIPTAPQRDKASAHSSPLFPASPKDEAQPRWSRDRAAATGTATRADSYDRGSSASLKSARQREADLDPHEETRTLPRQVKLPSAPHLVPADTLSQLLPIEQIVALVQALSARTELHEAQQLQLEHENDALQALALEKGAGQGEIDRAKVRARADAINILQLQAPSKGKGEARGKKPYGSDREPPVTGEWKMDLLRPPDTTSDDGKQRAVEVLLDLNELADAISDNNAYDLGSPILPAFTLADLDGTLKAKREQGDDASSISRTSIASIQSVKSQPLPGTTTPASLGIPTAAKSGGRGRHASLSSRIFGSLTGAAGSVVESAQASSTTNQASGSTAATASSPPSKLHRKHHGTTRSLRSDSIKSDDSNSSLTAGAVGGYGEWIWGRGWSKGKRRGQADIQNHFPVHAEDTGQQEGQGTSGESVVDDLLTPTPEQSKPLVGADSQDFQQESEDASIASTHPLRSPDPIDFTSSSSPSRDSSLLCPSSSPTLSRSSSNDVRRPSFTERGTSPEPAQCEVIKVEVLAKDIVGPVETSSASGSNSTSSPDHHASEESEGEPTIKARRSSTGSKRVPLELSLTSTTTDENKSYVSSAKETLGRAFGLGKIATPTSPGMKRSASDGMKGKRTGLGDTGSGQEPNLTMFPRLASMSHYSPFAQPHLSTPLTPVSLSSRPATATSSSASNATVSVAVNATAGTISAPTTMELSTLSAEAAPPTIRRPGKESTTNGKQTTKISSNDEGPLVDRYGFVYDIRSGMKLLREARRYKERLAKGETLAETDSALAAAADLVDQSAMPESAADRNEAPAPARDDKSLPARPVQLVRSKSSSSDVRDPHDQDYTAPSKGSTAGPASMKLLLTTLKDMSDALERSQKIVWDAFIQKRQAVLASNRDEAAGGTHHHSSSKRIERRAANRANRPRTIVHDLNSLMNDAFQEQDDTDDQASVDEKDWTEDLVGVSQMGLAGKSGKEDWAEFKELVRRGVPIAYRPKIWAECSGANEAREPGVYQDLLTQHRGQENQCLNQIDMDCHRTFPTNVFFAGNGPGVAKLRNVLVAYSWRNPKIGYCQGMNNLTATLLLTYPSEEEAFWVLVCIIEKILPSDYYTSHLLVSQADQRVLKDLIEKLMPDVTAHLEDLGVELPAVTFGWFLSLFTDSLPIQTLLRIWDLIFVLGTVMLFRVAVAILQMNHDEILACDSAASLYALMRSMTSHLYQVDKLLKIACEDLRPLIKDRDISALRTRHAIELRVELGIAQDDGEDSGPRGTGA